MNSSSVEMLSYVKGIVDEVKEGGDKALIEFTKSYDKVELKQDQLKVDDKTIMKAYDQVDPSQIEAIRYLKKHIESIENERLKLMTHTFERKESRVFSSFFPIQSVGCYVPGGRAVYPSTLLMTVVPAKIAGVPKIVVASPPTYNEDINPLILVTADICGVDEVYRIGGAQAIAAMAYGTESIPSVLKIVGPGRGYVTTAKILVSKDVAIDVPAGPSEVLIMADEAANPRFVALDLISQAEHGEESIAVLVTTSNSLACKVIDELKEMLEVIPRCEHVSKALMSKGRIIVCRDIDEAIDVTNSFAPEHLEIQCRDPESIAKNIFSAGIILLGQYTPVSVTDYCVGTNHVLPTDGYGHVYSGLSVFDYVRRVDVVKCSKEGLFEMINPLKTLSHSEGLPNHYLAVERRFSDD
jgi:histidinol dehydrogenase